MPRLTILASILAVSLLGAADARADELPDPYAELLKQHGIETEADVRRYLADLQPNANLKKQAAALTRQLGDDDFFKREEAMHQLIRRPVGAVEFLRQAAEDDDPEIRWRARYVLKNRRRDGDRVLHAVLRAVADRKLKGLAEHVIAAVPLCGESYMHDVAAKALGATVVESDVELLKRSLGDEDASVRMAVCATVGKLAGEQASESLVPLLDDPDDRVRLAAAEALANLGDRKCLPVLGELLESPDANVRVGSVRVLRAVTGRRFRFVAYAQAAKRSESVEAWRAWIQREGPAAKLAFPLRAERPHFGRTLMCNRVENMVGELGAQGKPVWKAVVSSPYGCHATADGHRLVASYSGRFVTEYDADGNEVWKVTDLPPSPYSVRRLENGNTLVACYSSKKVVEIRPDKTTAWEVTLEDNPRDARRLENGNTLICLYLSGRVVEVDRMGDTVWELAVNDRVYSAQRLPNGNTLVCEYANGRVVEWDQKGREVWAKDVTGRMFDAQRLPNGNTLFVDSLGVHEIVAAGDVVWQHRAIGLRRAFRY